MTHPTTIPIEAAQAALGCAAILVDAWRRRQTTRERTCVADGHDAVKAIDATVRALYDARAVLIAELRADEIERAARVDVMIAEWQAARGGYHREDPATGKASPRARRGLPPQRA